MVVHGFMESDSYSPLLNISVIPQVTYRLVRFTFLIFLDVLVLSSLTPLISQAPAIWKKMYNYDQVVLYNQQIFF